MVPAVLMTAGCSVQSFLVQDVQAIPPEQLEIHSYTHTGKQEINAVQVCGNVSRVAKVQILYTPWNWMLSYLSWGVYSPLEVRIWCLVADQSTQEQALIMQSICTAGPKHLSARSEVGDDSRRHPNPKPLKA